MQIIISPAKKMNRDNEVLAPQSTPVFMAKAEQLKSYLQTLSYEDLKKLLQCNDAIAALNYQRFQNMHLQDNTAPALLAYEGIQYQYMAPQVFTSAYFDYVQKHLRILSGFYGVLKPLDGIVPYRLEMQAKLKTTFCKNLYDFWQDSLYKEITQESHTIINLASTEYSKTISKYLTSDITYITCRFGELHNEKVIEKGVYVKMARGEMVRFMAEQNVTTPQEVQGFTGLGFHFSPAHSTDDTYTFLKQ